MRGKKRTIAAFVSLVVGMVIFLGLPGSTLALDKSAQDWNVFWFPGNQVQVLVYRYLSFSYYYSGSGYYCTCIVYYHSQGGVIKDYDTLPAPVDVTGKNEYYANGNYVTTVYIPNQPGLVEPGDKGWGGSTMQNISLWPAYNDRCDGVEEVFLQWIPLL